MGPQFEVRAVQPTPDGRGLTLTVEAFGDDLRQLHERITRAATTIQDHLRAVQGEYLSSAKWAELENARKRAREAATKLRDAEAELSELEQEWREAFTHDCDNAADLERKLTEARASLPLLRDKASLLKSRAEKIEADVMGALHRELFEALENYRRETDRELDAAKLALGTAVSSAAARFLEVTAKFNAVAGLSGDSAGVGKATIAGVMGEIEKPRSAGADSKARVVSPIKIHGAHSKDPDRELKPGEVVKLAEIRAADSLLASGALVRVEDEES